MPNRLQLSLSPYLRQHAGNPVDWWEWSPEAFAAARERDVPILLSVGYAACHWCHVMAHESFEDAEVAAAMNGAFVCIKVDREERPDVDAVYMAATTALTGRGGWPMTCFLTPDGEPFYAGTYVPKRALLQLLDGVRNAWTTQRDKVDLSAAQIVSVLQAAVPSRPAGPVDTTASAGSDGVDPALLDRAEAVLARQFDPERGGFGGAPKFPPSMVLEWLLRRYARTGSPEALHMAATTCEAMARGGIYDQLAGGFARYAVDADWVVPHFEKMLYDNAQLLAVYLHWWRIGGDPLARRIAVETADFIVRGLGTPQGGFASALDADAAGVEGQTYAWTPRALVDVLGPQDGRRAARLLNVTDTGTFEHGTSTLQLRADPEDPEDPALWERVRPRLLEARAGRPQPARDDKVVTSWNGIAIGALAETGVLLGRPDLLDASIRCAEFLVEAHLDGGLLRRASLDGVVGTPAGVADDYGNLASGLLTVYQMTGTPRWLEVAGTLLGTALNRFRAQDGGFHDTGVGAEKLFIRPRGLADNAEPSGQSSLALALLSYGALTGSAEHLEAAGQALASSASLVAQNPRFAGWALAGMEALAAGPLEVAIVHPDPEPDEAARTLIAMTRESASPGLVCVHGVPDAPGSPLLADRPLVDGRTSAYICRGLVCDRPVTDPADLVRALY